MSVHMPEFTVLPSDVPMRCSRCLADIGPGALAVDWNDVRFQYCAECEAKAAPK